jgi:hypothetical protein
LPDLRVEIAKCDREGDLEPGLGAVLPDGESPVRLFEREAQVGTRPSWADQCDWTKADIGPDQHLRPVVCDFSHTD